VLATYLFAFLLALIDKAQSDAPLKLTQTIPMPGVQGRMDHMGVHVKGNRYSFPPMASIAKWSSGTTPQAENKQSRTTQFRHVTSELKTPRKKHESRTQSTPVRHARFESG
jgi:hypothetical protein